MNKKTPVEIETASTVFEKSKQHPVIVKVEPSGMITLRLKGTVKRRQLEISAGSLFWALAQQEFGPRKRRTRRK